jgi:hypothetical protein
MHFIAIHRNANLIRSVMCLLVIYMVWDGRDVGMPEKGWAGG